MNGDEYGDNDKLLLIMKVDEYGDRLLLIMKGDEYGDNDRLLLIIKGDEYGDAPHKVLSNLAVRLLFPDLSRFSGFAPSSLQRKLCKYFHFFEEFYANISGDIFSNIFKVRLLFYDLSHFTLLAQLCKERYSNIFTQKMKNLMHIFTH